MKLVVTCEIQNKEAGIYLVFKNEYASVYDCAYALHIIAKYNSREWMIMKNSKNSVHSSLDTLQMIKDELKKMNHENGGLVYSYKLELIDTK